MSGYIIIISDLIIFGLIILVARYLSNIFPWKI